jgi:hypothetical protein
MLDARTFTTDPFRHPIEDPAELVVPISDQVLRRFAIHRGVPQLLRRPFLRRVPIQAGGASTLTRSSGRRWNAECAFTRSRRRFSLALNMESGSTRAAALRLAVTERAAQTYRADSRASA